MPGSLLWVKSTGVKFKSLHTTIITLLMRLPLAAHPLDGIFPGIPVLLSLHCLNLLFLPCIQEVEGEAIGNRHQLDCFGWEPKATASLSTAPLLLCSRHSCPFGSLGHSTVLLLSKQLV